MKRAIILVMMVGCLLGRTGLAEECVQGEQTHIWIAPQPIKPGVPVRIMAVSTEAPITEVLVTNPQGKTEALDITVNTGGKPWSAWLEIDPLVLLDV